DLGIEEEHPLATMCQQFGDPTTGWPGTHNDDVPLIHDGTSDSDWHLSATALMYVAICATIDKSRGQFGQHDPAWSAPSNRAGSSTRYCSGSFRNHRLHRCEQK